MKTPVAFRVRSHDGGTVSLPLTLIASASRLFMTLSSRESDPPTISSSVSEDSSPVLFATFEIEIDACSPFSPDSVFATFASASFDPDGCWLRSALGNDHQRSKLYHDLKSIVPVPGSQVCIDYLRNLAANDTPLSGKNLVRIPLDSRFLDNARQALVPSMDDSECVSSPHPDFLRLGRFAWRGTVLESIGNPWPFRVNGNGNYQFVEDEHLGRLAEGMNLDILKDSIQENLVFLWRTYVLESDDRLTNGARRLKNYLKTRIKEIRRG